MLNISVSDIQMVSVIVGIAVGNMIILTKSSIALLNGGTNEYIHTYIKLLAFYIYISSIYLPAISNDALLWSDILSARNVGLVRDLYSFHDIKLLYNYLPG
jgi:hypothetical protein